MRPLTAIAALWLAGVTAAHAAPSPGQGDLFGTRALGMGRAFRSVASSNDAIFFNPAGVAYGQRYELDGAYGFSPGDRLSLFNASVVDSKTSRMAAGLSYSHLGGSGDAGEVSASLVHLALGMPLGDKALFGVGLKYLGFSRPVDTNSVTADVGLLLRPLEIFTLGLVAYNVIDVASDVAPFQVGGGVSIGSDSSFRVAFDVVADLEEVDDLVSLHAGAEYLLDYTFPIRLGFERKLQENRNYLTAGLGLLSARAGIEAAFSQNLRSGESSDRIFALTAKLFL